MPVSVGAFIFEVTLLLAMTCSLDQSMQYSYQPQQQLAAYMDIQLDCCSIYISPQNVTYATSYGALFTYTCKVAACKYSPIAARLSGRGLHLTVC